MPSTVVPFFAIVLAVVSIQFGAAFAKQLFPITGAIGLTAMRLLLASGMLMMFWRPWRERLSYRQFKAVALYGMALGFMNLTFYLAIERIPLGLAVAIEFIGPLVLAIVGSRKKTDFLWAALAGVGIFLISPLSTHAHVDILGVVFALFAAFCWALYIILGQRVSLIMHEGYATSYGMAIATLAITPVVFLADGYASFSFAILPKALVVALLASAIPYSLEMFALKRISKLSFGILMSLEPAMASLAGLLILHEVLSATQIIAISFIMIASVGTTFSATNRKISTSKTLSSEDVCEPL